MSAELRRLGEELILSGFTQGGTVVVGLSESLREAELIPDSLGNEGSPLARGRKFGPRNFPIDLDALRRLREEKNLSQRRLAGASVVSISTVSAIERGKTPVISEETASRLARGLGVEATSLRKEEDPQS